MNRALLLAGALAIHACKSQAPRPGAPEISARETDVRNFINTYFQSWSSRDLATYGHTFHPRARIWFTDQGPLEKEPFLQTQRQAHSASLHPLKEVPLSMEVTLKGSLAHVNVYWELDRGTDKVRGYDFFTLVFAEGRWQILALVFNQES